MSQPSLPSSESIHTDIYKTYLQSAIANQTTRFHNAEGDSRELLKVGIQIRVGDSVFQKGVNESDLTFDKYMPFFDCAKQIADTRKAYNSTKVRMRDIIRFTRY